MTRVSNDPARAPAGDAVVVAGRRLSRGGRPWWCRGVCYGPFPAREDRGWLPSHGEVERDFVRMADCGLNTVRLFHPPPEDVPELAAAHGLVLLAGLPWDWQIDFLRRPGELERVADELAVQAGRWRDHPAVAGWVVANEIHPTMVRWLGRDKVAGALDLLCARVRAAAPEQLALYASYPPTEWLVPDCGNVAGMNIYLEEEEALRRYLRRAHHLAGERPLLLTEFGIDRLARGAELQREWVERAYRIAAEEGAAGLCWFTWSDAWRDARSGGIVQGWKFGLIGEDGVPHPAYGALPAALAGCTGVPDSHAWPKVSVLVCSRNGRASLPACLRAVAALDYPAVECIVVDDGSTDGSAGEIAGAYPGVKVLVSGPIGLGAARNLAAAAATGAIFAYLDDDCEPDVLWLRWAVRAMVQRRWDLAGGPNLAPATDRPLQKVLDRLPGLASHVLLDDERAEHLPGCNLLVRRAVFAALGGFDTRFHTAGDDVDFCWRALAATYRVGFTPLAVVWHHRRSTPWRSLKQQYHYGRAECLLAEVWTDRVGPGGARWAGAVYGVARQFARVYHGVCGHTGYPMLEVAAASNYRPSGLSLYWVWLYRVLSALQPWARALGRWAAGMHRPGWPERPAASRKSVERPMLQGAVWHPLGGEREALLTALTGALRARGWVVGGDDGWQDYDLAIAGATGGETCRLLTVTEYTSRHGRLTRWRVSGADEDCRAIVAVLHECAEQLGYELCAEA